MYRHTDDRKVWYEWMVEVFALEPTSSFSFSPAPAGLGGAWQQQQQQQGQQQEQQQGQGSGRRHPRPGFRRVRMGMSDLHSSVKEGCLMWCSVLFYFTVHWSINHCLLQSRWSFDQCRWIDFGCLYAGDTPTVHKFNIPLDFLIIVEPDGLDVNISWYHLNCSSSIDFFFCTDSIICIW